MTDQLLSVFKILLLVLLYLFFARVLWAVWSEVRSPKRSAGGQRAAAQQQQQVVAPAPIVQVQSPPPGMVQAPAAAATSNRTKRGRVTKMVVIEPRSRKGASFAIGDELTIGRSSGCTVPITDDEFISQVHARAFTANGDVFVEDLGSTNGSFYNGNRLTTAVPLSKGDRLQIGNTVLEAS